MDNSGRNILDVVKKVIFVITYYLLTRDIVLKIISWTNKEM